MTQDQRSNDALLDDLLAQAQNMIEEQDIVIVVEDTDVVIFDDLLPDTPSPYTTTMQPLGLLDTVDMHTDADWATYMAELERYATRQGIELNQDPFRDLMTDSQRIALEKRIKDEFSYKAAACDKYDYMIAGTCGLIGGIVDVFFVGVPGKGALSKWADNQTDNAIRKFAELNGWDPKKEKIASAIGFLEGKFKINYDHATSHATGGAVKNMSMSNHHVKSLGHSPDLVGLFFSILDQFTNTAHFVDKGKLISIDTDTFRRFHQLAGASVFRHGRVFGWTRKRGRRARLGHSYSLLLTVAIHQRGLVRSASPDVFDDCGKSLRVRLRHASWHRVGNPRSDHRTAHANDVGRQAPVLSPAGLDRLHAVRQQS
jgi:hypothetical protein